MKQRVFNSYPSTGSVTRTIKLAETLTPEQRTEQFNRQYPASMFAVHDVPERKLSAIEIENNQRMSALIQRLSPLEREKLEQRLMGKTKPLHHLKKYVFKHKVKTTA